MKRTPLKRISDKHRDSMKHVASAKKTVLQRVLNNYGYYKCESCETTQGMLHCSHSIAISKRKDLEAVPDIIFLQCPKCHELTEHGHPDMVKFVNYEQMMNVIKRYDEGYYRRLCVKHNKKA